MPFGLSVHALWDNMILGSDRFTDVRNKAIELLLRGIGWRGC